MKQNSGITMVNTNGTKISHKLTILIVKRQRDNHLCERLVVIFMIVISVRKYFNDSLNNIHEYRSINRRNNDR